MPLLEKSNHLDSDQHKNKTKQQREAVQIWCEDCGKYISNKTRHFQSEIHKGRVAPRTSPHIASHTTPHFGQEDDVIVNEKTYLKLKIKPTGAGSQNLEKQVNDLLRTSFFPRYNFQLSYLAKFLKYGEEENVFHKWVKSDFNYNHTNVPITQTSMFIIHYCRN